MCSVLINAQSYSLEQKHTNIMYLENLFITQLPPHFIVSNQQKKINKSKCEYQKQFKQIQFRNKKKTDTIPAMHCNNITAIEEKLSFCMRGQAVVSYIYDECASHKLNHKLLRVQLVLKYNYKIEKANFTRARDIIDIYI